MVISSASSDESTVFERSIFVENPIWVVESADERMGDCIPGFCLKALDETRLGELHDCGE